MITSTPSYIIDSSKPVNFLGGNGKDLMCGSTRNESIWGDIGNDALNGFTSSNDNDWEQQHKDYLFAK